MRTISMIALPLVCLLLIQPVSAQAPERYPGVWAIPDFDALPLPASGFQVFLIGEMHGVKEIEGIFLQYLAILHKEAGLRDVAIEEDAVYQPDAEAYVEGRWQAVPEPLCLRAGILRAVRQFNEGLKAQECIRIHLVDIDTPATAIRRHLLSIKDRIAKASKVRIPEAENIRKRGLETVKQLNQLASDSRILGELRTVGYSILALRQGLEAGTGNFKGSPYLDDREQAIADNIGTLLQSPDCRVVLALYGSDHVSKAMRKDGGPERDRDFAPMALRLERSGVRVFSMVTFPLSGRWRWRGQEGEVLWLPEEGRLDSGVTLDRVIASVPEATMLYIDPMRQKIKLPSQDVNKFKTDAFLLLVNARAMDDYCRTP